MKFIAKLSVGIVTACLLCSGAFAALIEIEEAMDYHTDNLVGTAAPGTASSNLTNEVLWANQILALTFNTTTTILGVDYRTHNTDEYTGLINDTGAVKLDTGSTSVIAGFDYVMGKYDGQNAGYVLFFLGGDAATIPQFSPNIWVNPNGDDEGEWELSHWTAFNPTSSVPEPGTLGLLGFGLIMLGFAKRRRLV